MKANWKIALMCLATLAMVACKDKNQPVGPGGGGEGGGGEEEEYVNPISVSDNSAADWNALPTEYVVSATCPADAPLTGLKSVKVFADEVYINILIEYDPEDITDLSWVPFHVYLNVDNSDATGGYGDQFLDANTDILLEGGIFGEGNPISYNPAVFKWWGEVGENGWLWKDPAIGEGDASNFWGAIIGEGQANIGASQLLAGNKIEIQLLRELIPSGNAPGWSENEFGIGFDIQQNWESAGILPLVSPTDTNANGHTNKLQVKIKK